MNNKDNQISSQNQNTSIIKNKDILYQNPLHPLDLSTRAYEIIKEKFEKQSLLKISEEDKGINVEILWKDFQSILDNESSIREEVLDWVMFELPIKKLYEADVQDFKPKYRESERMYLIDKINELKIDNKLFYVVVFDDSTVSIIKQSDLSYACEFSLKYDFMADQFFQQVEQTNQMQKSQEKKIKFSTQPDEPLDPQKLLLSQMGLSKPVQVTESINKFKKAQRLASNAMAFQQQSQKAYQERLLQDNSEQISHFLQCGEYKDNQHKNNLGLINTQIDKHQYRIRKAKQLIEKILNEKQQQKKFQRKESILNTTQKRNAFDIMQILQIAIKIAKFAKIMLQKLEDNKRKKNKIQTMSDWKGLEEEDENYYFKNKQKIKQMFEKFKELPVHLDSQYCRIMNQTLVDKNIHKINISHLKNLQHPPPIKEKYNIQLLSKSHNKNVQQTTFSQENNMNKSLQSSIVNENDSLLNLSDNNNSQTLNTILTTDNIALKHSNSIEIIQEKTTSINNNNTTTTQNTQQINQNKKVKQVQQQLKLIINKQNTKHEPRPRSLSIANQQDKILSTQENVEEYKTNQRHRISVQTAPHSPDRSMKKSFKNKNHQNYYKNRNKTELQHNLNEFYKQQTQHFLQSIVLDKQQFDYNPRSNINDEQRNQAYNCLTQKYNFENFHKKKKNLDQTLHIKSKYKESMNQKITEIKKSKKMHIFALDINNTQKLMALGTVTRELIFYIIYYDQNTVKVKQCFKKVYNHVINELTFYFNKIKQNWTIACLYENNTVKLYEYDYNQKEQDFKFHNIPFFVHQFLESPEDMYNYDGLGIVTSSYDGEFNIFMDRSTTQSKDTEASFQLYWKHKIQKRGEMQYLVCSAYSQNQKFLFFGTRNGNLIKLDPYSQEIIQIINISQKSLFRMHVFEDQNLLIVVCQDHMIQVFDINRLIQIQNMKVFEQNNIFRQTITCSFFSQTAETMIICGNQTKFFKTTVDKQLCLKQQKILNQYKWRCNEISKQNYKYSNNNESLSQPHSISENSNNKTIKQQMQQYVVQKKALLRFKKISLPHHDVNNFQFVNEQQEKNLNKTKFNQENIKIQEVFKTSKHFFIYTASQEIKIFCFKTFELKHSFIVLEDEQIECIVINDKVIAIATEPGNIILRNIYTYELFQIIQNYENYPLKFNKILFLPENCEYYLSCASYEGEIAFLTSTLKPNKRIKSKTEQAHSKKVLQMTCSSEYLVTGCEDMKIIIWSIRSCIIKNIISLNQESVQPEIYNTPNQEQQSISSIQNNISNNNTGNNNSIELTPQITHKQSSIQQIQSKDHIAQIFFSIKNEKLIYIITDKGNVHVINIYEGDVFTNLINIGNSNLLIADNNDEILYSIEENFSIKIFQKIGNIKELYQKKKMLGFIRLSDYNIKSSDINQQQLVSDMKSKQSNISTQESPYKMKSFLLGLQDSPIKRRKGFNTKSKDNAQLQHDEIIFYKQINEPIKLEETDQSNCEPFQMMVSPDNQFILVFLNKLSVYVLNTQNSTGSKLNIQTGIISMCKDDDGSYQQILKYQKLNSEQLKQLVDLFFSPNKQSRQNSVENNSFYNKLGNVAGLASMLNKRRKSNAFIIKK